MKMNLHFINQATPILLKNCGAGGYLFRLMTGLGLPGCGDPLQELQAVPGVWGCRGDSPALDRCTQRSLYSLAEELILGAEGQLAIDEHFKYYYRIKNSGFKHFHSSQLFGKN